MLVTSHSLSAFLASTRYIDHEDSAFRVRPEKGEHEYDENFCDVHPTIVRALESQDDLHVLIEQLPDAL